MLFIINPISGKRNKSNIISRLMKLGYDTVCTEYPGHAEELSRNTSHQTVVAVGGDGTVNEVARGLIGTGKTLGIIPCGSGDGLALHLGLSQNFQKALGTITAGRTRSLDAAKVNGRLFFSVCGVGLDAAVSERFAKSGKRGLANYIEQAIITWKDYTPESYMVEIDGKRMESEAVMITIGNSDQWGNGAKVTPLADSSDGELDITIVSPFRNVEIPLLAYKLMTGGVHEDSHVSCCRGRHIRIIRSQAGPAHIDGEWFDDGKELDIEVIPGALTVIIP